MKGFTDKQRAFIAEYPVDKNATQAAIRAGFSEKTARQQGQRLLTNVDIRAAIDAALAEQEKRIQRDGDTVLLRLWEIGERCMQAIPVRDKSGELVWTETASGDILPAYSFNAMAAIRAFELLGKHHGKFPNQHVHSGPEGGPIETADVTEFELARRLAFLLARVADKRETKGAM